VVIGGGIAGMAAAARLAKAGHPVELYERSGSLGGTWAPYPLAGGQVLVDDAPPVLGFPAPWRDLFRKSGRPLEAELGRMGYGLVPADPPTVIFADGTAIRLPTDRGEQVAAIERAYGRSAAQRWQSLLDRLAEVWQLLRPLGLEAELRGRGQLNRTTRWGLLHRQTVAGLADSLGHPALAALVRSAAYRQGSPPEETPAMVAVELFVARTFGRWQTSPLAGDPALDTGRSSVLVEALTARLAQRKVAVRQGTEVHRIAVRDGRVTGVATAGADRPAAAVVATTDPWQLTNDLLPASSGRRLRRDLSRSRPAQAPTIRHAIVDEAPAGVSETITLSGDGVPVVEYRRPAGERTVRMVHDFTRPVPRPSYGIAWQGFRSWLRRPRVSTEIEGLFLAGPFSPAGPGPSQVVLSAALAAYGCHDLLGDAATR
jgi:UDP-galactopyranose mutase